MKLKLTILFFISFLYSCSNKYDKMYVKDSNNNVYQLNWTVGESYILTPIKKCEIDSLFKK